MCFVLVSLVPAFPVESFRDRNRHRCSSSSAASRPPVSDALFAIEPAVALLIAITPCAGCRPGLNHAISVGGNFSSCPTGSAGKFVCSILNRRPDAGGGKRRQPVHRVPNLTGSVNTTECSSTAITSPSGRTFRRLPQSFVQIRGACFPANPHLCSLVLRMQCRRTRNLWLTSLHLLMRRGAPPISRLPIACAPSPSKPPPTPQRARWHPADARALHNPPTRHRWTESNATPPPRSPPAVRHLLLETLGRRSSHPPPSLSAGSDSGRRHRAVPTVSPRHQKSGRELLQ